MKIKTTAENFHLLDPQQNEWVYNALDASVSTEVWEESSATVQPHTYNTYNFVRGLQAPAMVMALRGISINAEKRAQWIRQLELRVAALQDSLDAMAHAVWDQPLNPRSTQQLQTFFYKVMGIPPEYKYDRVKKERVITTDKAALEKLRDYFHARPIVNNILRSRDLTKKISTLKSGVDADLRMRTSYNVCGTETGRWSSNENAFGSGTNLQNWTDELREIFEADMGTKIAYLDLEQAESRVVAYLSGDANYIRACESGDLHTTVAMMVWPELAWTDNPKANRAVADQKFYQHWSYRDMAKRLGHGTNYRGKPFTMAKNIKVSQKVVELFQDKYLRQAFPGIAEWHKKVAQDLQLNGFLTTPLGRTRYFLKRLYDDDTLKEAIAFLPQSTIGEILNEGMYRLWYEMESASTKYPAKLLAQVHDAVLIQYPDLSDEHETATLARAKELLQVPIPINGRQLIIPVSCEGTGWNWRKHSDDNVYGLKKWTGHETRKWTKANSSFLDRVIL